LLAGGECRSGGASRDAERPQRRHAFGGAELQPSIVSHGVPGFHPMAHPRVRRALLEASGWRAYRCGVARGQHLEDKCLAKPFPRAWIACGLSFFDIID